MFWEFWIIFVLWFTLIGFIILERRLMVKSIRNKLKDLEVKKVDRMLQALQRLAQDDPKLAEVLRSFSLL